MHKLLSSKRSIRDDKDEVCVGGGWAGQCGVKLHICWSEIMDSLELQAAELGLNMMRWGFPKVLSKEE